MTRTSPPEQLQRPNDKHVPWLLRRIWDRLNRDNEHFMGVIVGEEGSGKSHTALKIANTIDPSFTTDRVIFDVTDLLKTLKDGEHEPGQFWVLDEAGVQLGVRTWQERGQILANQALQLIRNHNLGLIFTLPRLSELDSQAQGRLQAFLELTDKEPDEYVAGKWKWMDPDRADDTGKIYKKYPRRRRDGQVIRVTEVAFTPPNDDLVEPYESKKSEFQKEFYEKTIEEIEGSEDGGDGDQPDSATDIAEEIKAEGDYGQYLSWHSSHNKWYLDKDLILEEFGTTHRRAKTAKKLLKNDPDVDIQEAAEQRDKHTATANSD